MTARTGMTRSLHGFIMAQPEQKASLEQINEYANTLNVPVTVNTVRNALNRLQTTGQLRVESGVCTAFNKPSKPSKPKLGNGRTKQYRDALRTQLAFLFYPLGKSLTRAQLDPLIKAKKPDVTAESIDSALSQMSVSWGFLARGGKVGDPECVYTFTPKGAKNYQKLALEVLPRAVVMGTPVPVAPKVPATPAPAEAPAPAPVKSGAQIVEYIGGSFKINLKSGSLVADFGEIEALKKHFAQ